MTNDIKIEEGRKLVQEGADPETLYSRWFHSGEAPGAPWPLPERYYAVIHSQDRFEPGWTITDVAKDIPGAVMVARGSVSRMALPLQYRLAQADHLSPERGEEAVVDALASAPAEGFWHIWSPPWLAETPEDYTRYYFNVRPDKARDWVKALVQCAPLAQTWAAKILTGPVDYARHDAAVVYVAQDRGDVPDWVRDLMEAAQPVCGPEQVPFATPYAPGIASAPDPGGGLSFGQALCGALYNCGGHARDKARFHQEVRSKIAALGGYLE
ncbi:MAG: T3SS effector HopA1 family protein [Pseudomonadota bacterium]